MGLNDDEKKEKGGGVEAVEVGEVMGGDEVRRGEKR